MPKIIHIQRVQLGVMLAAQVMKLITAITAAVSPTIEVVLFITNQ